MAARVLLSVAISLFLANLAGCGDPEKDRLAVGQKAMVVEKDKAHDVVYLSKASNRLMPGLPVGTRITVVSDDDESDVQGGSRMVTVHVEDGEFQGVSGKTHRSNVYPVK